MHFRDPAYFHSSLWIHLLNRTGTVKEDLEKEQNNQKEAVESGNPRETQSCQSKANSYVLSKEA